MHVCHTEKKNQLGETVLPVLELAEKKKQLGETVLLVLELATWINERISQV